MTHQQLALAALVAGAIVLILVWRYLWVLAIWGLLAAVDVAAVRASDGWHQVAAYAALPVLFLAWVLFYPDADCRVCNGKGGWSLMGFSRRCWKCGGGKKKQRITARVLGRGYPRQKGNWIAPKARPKNR